MKMRTRALTATTLGAVALSTAVAVAPTATAAPNSYAYNAARWLDDQLVDGIATYDQAVYDTTTWEITGYAPQPEYGVTIDIYLALHHLDTRTATQARIIDALAGHADDYVAGWGSVAPAAAGKLATAVVEAGQDPTAFGGRNLVDDIEGATDDATGETADTYGGVGQAWATRALVLAGSDEADASVGYLLSKQCPNGGFKQIYTADCGSDVEIDATALAIEALSDAVAKGITTAQQPLAKAAQALVGAQAQDGSFLGNGVPNTNSTGLAATALKLAGRTGAAGSAAAWVVRNQVTDANAEDSALANESGAVAYDPAALTAGRKDGVTPELRDQWIRATAQAATGVDAQLPAATVSVAKPASFTAAGATLAVRATGLLPGEKFTATISGGGKAVGTVPANGAVSTSVKAPAGTGVRTITVTGSRSNRTGSATASVLAAKKVGLKAAKTSVKRAKVQKVTVTGLAAKEPVRVHYRGKLVKRATASASGTYTYRFTVGRKLGKAKVVVRGAFDNRTGTKTFKVVK